MQITHAKSLTIADGANTDIVRPSDWNSGHALALTLTGNTAGNSTVSGTNILWSGGPGVTLSGTGSTVVISAGAGGGGAAISAGTQSQNTGTVVFSNSNGVTFGLSNGTLTASHNGLTSQSIQTQNLVSVLGSTGNISFANGNGVTFGGNASTVTASVATNYAASDHSHGNPTLALTNLSGTTASNSAGFTLSLSAGAGGAGDGINAIAVNGGGTQSATTYTLSNGNNVSFGLAAGVITATASYSQSTGPAAIVGSNATYTSGSVTFTGSNAVTVRSTTGQQIVIDAPVQSVQTQSNVQGISAGTTVARTGDVVFSNSNGITFGVNGNTVTASHNGLTSQSNQAFSAGGGSSAFQTLSFANGNGVTFTNTNGSVGASVATTYRASNDAVGLNTAGTNVTWTVNSGGISLNAGGYAGTGTSATNASITLNSNGLAISVAAPGGGGAINVSAGTTSGNLQTIQFDNSNGVSFGLDGSTLTASVAAAGGRTASGFIPYPGNPYAVAAVGQGSMSFYPHPGLNAFQIDRALFLANISNATNSSGSLTATIGFGIYTLTGGTLSVAHSTSQTYALTMSGTAGSYSLYSGIRKFSIPWTTTVSAGDYVFGVNFRTTTGGADMTFQPMVVSQLNSAVNGDFSAANAASRLIVPGLGIAGVSTSDVLQSIAISGMAGTATANLRPPVFFLTSGTA